MYFVGLAPFLLYLPFGVIVAVDIVYKKVVYYACILTNFKLIIYRSKK
jgi:hypothetical protein